MESKKEVGGFLEKATVVTYGSPYLAPPHILNTRGPLSHQLSLKNRQV